MENKNIDWKNSGLRSRKMCKQEKITIGGSKRINIRGPSFAANIFYAYVTYRKENGKGGVQYVVEWKVGVVSSNPYN